MSFDWNQTILLVFQHYILNRQDCHFSSKYRGNPSFSAHYFKEDIRQNLKANDKYLLEYLFKSLNKKLGLRLSGILEYTYNQIV